MDDARTLWCGNLSDKVTEELLYELFLQVAPLERVRIPADKEGRRSDYAFITLKHEISVDYAVQLLNGTPLFDRRIKLKPRNSNQNQQREQQQTFENQNLMNNFNDLFLMGQMMQLTYNNCLQPNYNQRQAFNNDRFNRDSYKQPYSRNDGYNSNRQGRGSHQRNNHRNHNDRTRRQRYY